MCSLIIISLKLPERQKNRLSCIVYPVCIHGKGEEMRKRMQQFLCKTFSGRALNIDEKEITLVKQKRSLFTVKTKTYEIPCFVCTHAEAMPHANFPFCKNNNASSGVVRAKVCVFFYCYFRYNSAIKRVCVYHLHGSSMTTIMK